MNKENRVKLKTLLVLLVAAMFLFSVSCKEKEDVGGPEKADVKEKTAAVEKAEKTEAVEKGEKSEKKEIGEKEEKEEEEGENEKAEAGEKEEAAKPAVDIKVLPEAVLSAFKAAYPNAVIKGASKEVENGVTLFEVESMDGTVARNLIYSVEAKISEIEEVIAAADLPGAVRATLAKEYPGYEVVTAETLIKGAVKQFELTIKVKDKKIGVTLDPAGKIVETSK
jgi:hypothetical protein